jgi:hypothetical protein
MFKNSYKFFLLVLIVCSCALSCDGRISKNKALQKSVSEFKANKVLEKNIYHPKTYNEQRIDTILSHDYSASLKTFTDMERHIPKTVKKGSHIENHLYRLVQTEFKVDYKGETIVTDIIDGDFIKRHLSYNEHDWSDYNLRTVWVDQASSLDENLLSIIAEFYSVQTEHVRRFTLLITNSGKMFVTEIKTNVI